MPGNLGVAILRRDEGDATVFVVLSFWESIEAVKRFAGVDYEKAKYYPEDGGFLLEFEPRVEHYGAVYLEPSPEAAETSPRGSFRSVGEGCGAADAL